MLLVFWCIQSSKFIVQRFYAIVSTSSRWFSISELLVEIDVAIAAVAVADDDELESLEEFRRFDVKVDDDPGMPDKLSFSESFAESIGKGMVVIN